MISTLLFFTLQCPARLWSFWSIPLPDAEQAEEARELKEPLDICLLPLSEGFFLSVATRNSYSLFVTAKHLQHTLPLYNTCCRAALERIKLERRQELMRGVVSSARMAKAAPAMPGGCCVAGSSLPDLPWCGQRQTPACTKGLQQRLSLM